MSNADHFARITPVEKPYARRVMNPWSLSINALKLLMFQTLWMWLVIAGAWLFNMPSELATRFGLSLCLFGLAALLLQCCFVFVYPEWPINLSLCAKLRRSILARGLPSDWICQPSRVVELVPRERLRKRSLETATDLLLIQIDEQGVRMEGDCDRYELSAPSILGAELERITPLGWHTPTFMVIVTVRTADGPIEIPIAYRDHSFGHLSRTRRYEQAVDLMHAINRVATGNQFQALVPPTVGKVTRPPRTSNPYAVPAFLD